MTESLAQNSIFLPIIYSILIGYILTRIAILISMKCKLIDHPSKRKIHSTPIYFGGGLAIFIGWTTITMTTLPLNHELRGLIIGLSVLFITGTIDDIFSITPHQKLLGQTVAATIMILNAKLDSNIITKVFYIVWLVGISNAFNLIDGVDGLAASIGITSCITLSLLSHSVRLFSMATILAGVLGGFLILNFHPAKIFMGDSGSNITGILLGYIAIKALPAQSSILAQALILLTVFSIPLADTFFAIARRLINKKSIIKADKGHIHHHLLNIGWSQRKVVLTLSVINAMVGIGGILIAQT